MKNLFGLCLLICSLLLVGCTSRGTPATHNSPTASAVSQSGAKPTSSSDESAGDCPDTSLPWNTSWLPSDNEVVAGRINAVLEGTGLAGQGKTILDLSKEYGINPAFALAMFRKESSFATSTSRAYRNNNPGNIIATGNCRGLPKGSSCQGVYGEIGTDGRFGTYATMADGIRAYFKLLALEYKPGTRHDCKDISCVVLSYCPPSECDVEKYVGQIVDWVQLYQCRLVGKGTSQTVEPTVKAVVPTPTSMSKSHGPQVAFRRNGVIWILDISSNRAHQLTSEGQVVSLAWSPDGAHLYYTLYGKGGVVFDYDMSSRQSTRIQIKGVKEIEDFDVSSDGKKFILLHDSSLENITTTLSLFDVEEKSLSTISSVPGLSTYVRLSPAGSKAAVTICIQGCTLMVYDLSNNSVEEHTELIFGDGVDFSPYGDNLVVESAPWATGFVPCGSSRCSVPEGLYTLNLGSGEYSPLVLSQTYNDALFEYPDVSGDGQYIVFQMSELHKESKIAFLSVKSGKVTVLTTGERPAWRP